MALFSRGSVVVVDFFFSDGSGSKLRPALVVAELTGDDLILCSITTSRSDEYSVELRSNQLVGGALRYDSFVRPNLLTTVDSRLVLRKIGDLYPHKMTEVIEKIIHIVTRS
ncbi:type II toxin-antitoxin system PemK/MazF family toxin [Thermodesulfobacteriota bacterium]